MDKILPQLAGPLALDLDDKYILRDRRAEYLDSFRSDFKKLLAEVKEETPEAWLEDRDAVIDSLAIELQRCVTRTYLILANEEAFRSGRLPCFI